MSVYQEIKRDLFRFLMAVVLFIVVADLTRCGYDATDNHGAGKRSGMALRIDHGTGCQYLEAMNGGLTPRLDSNNKQICEKAP